MIYIGFLSISNNTVNYLCATFLCNVCVISTNTGGLPEVNVHGVTGYLSNLGDVEDMAKNALEILKDDATLSLFKKRAKEHTKQFSLEIILPIYEKVYASLIKT